MGICIQKTATQLTQPDNFMFGTRSANTLEQTYTGLAVTNKSSG
ncbi:hypothetical protein LYNGBM3L_66520 [Moorena producens 3L]|uniref:Uncharacterized protein n=1 Tax=Moorena producens 3L TaxID=489825 RepID=F4Y1J8_9CYAN|nr:hypothetical protein LYNGBM3L_66520 [Moorena producens 3L]